MGVKRLLVAGTSTAWLALLVLALAGLILASPVAVDAWNTAVPAWMSVSERAGGQAGGALLAGSIVGGALLVAERSMEASQSRQQARFALSLAPTLIAIDLQGESLPGFYLRGKDLSLANLDRADLSEANLIDANLRGARLHRADLSDASMFRTNMAGVLWHEETTWPNEYFRQWILDRSVQRVFDGHYLVDDSEDHLEVPWGWACGESDPRFRRDLPDVVEPDQQLGYL